MKTTVLLLAALLLAAPCTLAEDVIKDDTYNMPPAVTAAMGVDEAMTKMETAVKPEVLDAFKKAHPAPFWLFGEDRQLAVRNNIIPAHWFEGGARQFGKFSGVARPGEFYVFQVAVVGGEKGGYFDAGYPVAGFDKDKNGVCLDAVVKLPLLKGAEARLISHDNCFMVGEVKPVWIGIQIPKDAVSGAYQGVVEFSNSIGLGLNKKPAPQSLAFTLKVEGAPIADSGTGTGEAWRLARLKWLDSKIGDSDTEVTRPFTPIKVDATARTLDILGRRVTIGENGIPAQFTSFFSGSNTKILATGKDAFASAPKLEVVVGGKVVAFAPKEFKFTKQTPVGVEWEANSTSDDFGLIVTGHLEFDGNLQLQMRVTKSGKGLTLDDVRFVVPWTKDTAKYAMGLGLQGGNCPEKLDWKWDIKKNQDSIWMGNANIGAMFRFKGGNYHRPLINAYYAFQPLALPDSWGGGGIRVETKEDAKTLVASSGPVLLRSLGDMSSGLHFNLDLHLTPFKPLDIQKHFTDRYHHIGAGSPTENPAALKKEGANIINVHQGRLFNPYINYPYNDDSIGGLTDFIKKSHGEGMRVGVYYTTRELTQNLPEFFALKSLDGEIILPRKEGVNWPVTNRNGPHPWLQQHVGIDIVPAWREGLHYKGYKSQLDLSVITTPDSRWNNFYLEGLNLLVKQAGIDGIYIDDTALDRKSMQRARRILDADGHTDRRVNMHSWNHYNGLAAWTSSSMAFMELYPYYDSLWHGEGFNADAAPEYMLVEMSGIPYGLMGEMLDHPNKWHGFVFGMKSRWGWNGGDPRSIWAVEDAFGITQSEFIGWWDKACPVQTGNPKIKASVCKKDGKTLIALASWDKDAKVKLAVDWAALGLDPAKVKLTAPAIKGFQEEAVFAPADEIPVKGNQGWILVAQ